LLVVNLTVRENALLAESISLEGLDDTVNAPGSGAEASDGFEEQITNPLASKVSTRNVDGFFVLLGFMIPVTENKASFLMSG
jgi:hypothetical protein